MLTLDDEDVYYRRVIRRAARKVRPEGVSDVPGVLFVQIDGLGMAVLRRAVRDGNAPALARWLASGSHRLLGWETGIPRLGAASRRFGRRGAIYLTALPGQLALETISGCAPVNAAAAVGSLRS